MFPDFYSFFRSVAGPSLTVWNKDGRFKERIYGKNELPPASSGIQMSVRRMPGKRFGLVERQNLWLFRFAPIFLLSNFQ